MTKLEKFKEKSNTVHDFKYDYSLFIFINNKTKGIIICKKHGEFFQTPDGHLSGHGCNICGGSKQSNTNEFIKKAQLVHKEKYGYLKVNYYNAHTSVIITCFTHGDFDQTPTSHLSGKGCKNVHLLNNLNDNVEL